MRFRRAVATILAPLFIAAATPMFSQVGPAATKGGLPLAVGAGFSDYDIDFGAGRREEGGTVWADWTIRQMPRILQGIGVTLEARDISLHPPAGLSYFQYDTAGGGVIYHYLGLRNIHPYAKGLEEFGNVDFNIGPGYSHDTRNFFAMGGGADLHAWRHVWLRADYEYQIWPGMFGRGHALTPNGFTIGPQYDFGGWGGQ